MSAEDMPVSIIYLVIGSIVGFAALLTLIWNFSKKITTMELNISSLEKRHAEDIKNIENKHLEDIQDSKLQIEKNKAERKDEIGKAVLNQIAKFETIQKQIDSQRSDVKDISSRVTQLDQKSKYADEAIKELKDALNSKLDSEKSFFADWNQRIEDRITKTHESIEKLRQEFLGMFTAFHAHNDGDNKK